VGDGTNPVKAFEALIDRVVGKSESGNVHALSDHCTERRLVIAGRAYGCDDLGAAVHAWELIHRHAQPGLVEAGCEAFSPTAKAIVVQSVTESDQDRGGFPKTTASLTESGEETLIAVQSIRHCHAEIKHPVELPRIA